MPSAGFLHNQGLPLNSPLVLGPLARLRSKWPGLPNSSKVAGLFTRSTWAFAVFPRSGGLMVIERFLEGRGRGGGPPFWADPSTKRGISSGATDASQGLAPWAPGQENPLRPRPKLLFLTGALGPNKGTAGGSIKAESKPLGPAVTKVQPEVGPVRD